MSENLPVDRGALTQLGDVAQQLPYSFTCFGGKPALCEQAFDEIVKEIGESRDAILRLAIPSLLGGGLGAYLLLHTPNKVFANLVPWLILMATGLFMAQEPLARAQRARTAQAEKEALQSGVPLSQEGDRTIPPGAWAGVIGFQFLVAVYGGYFGAGIGILMLAALGFMGFTNIHRMNGLMNINGLCINRGVIPRSRAITPRASSNRPICA